MSDPLALVPLAAAAHGGTIDDVPTGQLVAAGLTLLQRCAPLVRALAGKRAGILLPTTPAYLTALAAADGRGAVLINPLAAPPEIEHQLTDADVGAVLTIASLAGKLPPAIPRVLLDDAPRSARYEHAGDRREVDLGSHVGLDLAGDPDVPGRDEEAVIVYTSAMEGTPLGAILTHRNLLFNARAAREAAALESDAHSLALLPFAHLFGFTITLLAPLLVGGRVTTLARFNPARALELLETRDITLLLAVPSIFKGLLALLEKRGDRLRAGSLRVCICGGAPLERVVQDRWADVAGVELRQGYGLTEAGPACLFNGVRLPNARGTLGLPFPGVRVRILEPGEIAVTGENVFRGYVRDGDRGLRREGEWLRTGDLGDVDAEGRVTFRGVLKPMFTRNGFNIYPRELERAVGAMPGVRRVSVRALPDAARENEIALDIVGDVEREAVERWCAERLSVYKQPGVIAITPP
ncbi:MAG TPA: AMP-binding protein [Gemmatimonadaceae bacterium]|nr:AMP-binding protein [Gemmatimonadaceae bacterium]